MIYWARHLVLLLFVLFAYGLLSAASPSPPHLVQMAMSSLNSGNYEKLASLADRDSRQFAIKRYAQSKSIPDGLRPGQISDYDFKVVVETDGGIGRLYRVQTRSPEGKEQVLFIQVHKLRSGWGIVFSETGKNSKGSLLL